MYEVKRLLRKDMQGLAEIEVLGTRSQEAGHKTEDVGHRTSDIKCHEVRVRGFTRNCAGNVLVNNFPKRAMFR